MKSSNSWRIKLWSLIVLCLSRSKECKEGTTERGKTEWRKQRTAAAVFLCTFGALSKVHFLHSIYHFKAQEVKNPMLQAVCDSELKRRSYSHCKSITLKCCEISLLLREFRSLFVQCYGIPPEATRYMPQAGSWEPQGGSQLRSPVRIAWCCEVISQPSWVSAKSRRHHFSPAKCSWSFPIFLHRLF